MEDWSEFDLGDHRMTLSVNGEQVVEGSSSELVWEHLFDAVSWLARQPALAGRGIIADDIIMTGSCTGIRPLQAGDQVVADFGALGRVRASFRLESV